jgi:rhamnogalacturonan endolyase
MAAVFLGDNRPGPDNTTLDQGARYYYRTYTDRMGAFIIPHVRSGTYNLQAWPNGGKIGDVTTVFSQNDVTIVPGSENNLNGLGWKTQDRKRIWQIGNMDRKATGFKYAGSPRNNDIHKKCPGSLVYNVGKSKPTDWCFAQWDVGQWSINFDITASSNVLPEAVLSVSLAAYTTGKGSNVFVNNVRIGSLFSASFLGDPAIARSATLAGEWRYIELRIPLGVLKNGPNLVEIRMAKINGLNGYIYDSVLLEWA